MDPFIGLGLGLLNAGMGIAGAQSQHAGQMQAYKDQLKFQKANEQFAKFQAKFNKKATDAQAKFQYWGQVVGYNREKAYTNSLRNIEKVKSFKQAKVVFETRAAAGASYIQDSQALSAAYGVQSMQEAVSLQQYQWRALQTRGSVQAMEREGQSVDRIVNDYARQMGDYETLMQINQGIRSRQYTREQAAQVSQYLSRWNGAAVCTAANNHDAAPAVDDGCTAQQCSVGIEHWHRNPWWCWCWHQCLLFSWKGRHTVFTFWSWHRWVAAVRGLSHG